MLSSMDRKLKKKKKTLQIHYQELEVHELQLSSDTAYQM